MSLRNPSARYILAKATPKSSCPQCGKRRFRRYVDTHTGELLPENVGCCDRENNCGYLYTAMDYMRDSGGRKSYEPEALALPPPKPVRDDWRVPSGKWEKTQVHHNNALCQYLLQHLGDNFKKVWEEYKVGTFPAGAKDAGRWAGATVYWLFNSGGELLNGKLMHYSGVNRNKDFQPTWISRIITGQKSEDIGAIQCLFGEHLLPLHPDAPVAVVESEKTALIGRFFFPQAVWVATGGSGNMSGRKMLALQGRNVFIFPDAGKGMREWAKHAERYEPLFESMTLSTFVEEMASEQEKQDGADIADFLLQGILPEDPFAVEPQMIVEVPSTGPVTITSIVSPKVPQEVVDIVKLTPASYAHPASSIVDKLVADNPAIGNLINVLELDMNNISIGPLNEPH